MIVGILWATVAITAADPLFVAEARGGVTGGQLRIEVAGEGGAAIEPARARGKLSGNRMTVFVKGARVRASNRQWEGAVKVVAHRHAAELELEAVLPPGAVCAGPIAFVGGEGGRLSARLNCSGLANASAPAAKAVAPVAKPVVPPAKPVVPAAKSGAAAAKSTVPPAATPTPPVTRQAAYRPSSADEGNDVVAPQISPVTQATPKARAPAPAPRVASPPPMPPSLSRVERVTPPPARARIAQGPAAAQAEDSPVSVQLLAAGIAVLAILLGGGLALGLWFAHRQHGPSRIRIIERRRLAAGRWLVVAEVDGRQLLLGASDTGVSVLRTLDGGLPDAPAPVVEPPVEPGASRKSVVGIARAVTPQPPSAMTPHDPYESAEAAALRELFGPRGNLQ